MDISCYTQGERGQKKSWGTLNMNLTKFDLKKTRLMSCRNWYLKISIYKKEEDKNKKAVALWKWNKNLAWKNQDLKNWYLQEGRVQKQKKLWHFENEPKIWPEKNQF